MHIKDVQRQLRPHEEDDRANRRANRRASGSQRHLPFFHEEFEMPTETLGYVAARTRKGRNDMGPPCASFAKEIKLTNNGGEENSGTLGDKSTMIQVSRYS